MICRECLRNLGHRMRQKLQRNPQAGAKRHSSFAVPKVHQIATVALVLLASGAAASKEKKQQVTPEPTPPEMQLLGGRKLTYERSFHSAREVQPKRGFWKKVLDFVAEPEFHTLVRPYSVATDSRGRDHPRTPAIPVGGGTLNITSIAITGADLADFAQTNNCPATIATMGTCTITVTFSPTATGSRSAALAVTDNASSSPQDVALTGTGN